MSTIANIRNNVNMCIIVIAVMLLALQADFTVFSLVLRQGVIKFCRLSGISTVRKYIKRDDI